MFKAVSLVNMLLTKPPNLFQKRHCSVTSKLILHLQTKIHVLDQSDQLKTNNWTSWPLKQCATCLSYCNVISELLKEIMSRTTIWKIRDKSWHIVCLVLSEYIWRNRVFNGWSVLKRTNGLWKLGRLLPEASALTILFTVEW